MRVSTETLMDNWTSMLDASGFKYGRIYRAWRSASLAPLAVWRSSELRRNTRTYLKTRRTVPLATLRAALGV